VVSAKCEGCRVTPEAMAVAVVQLGQFMWCRQGTCVCIPWGIAERRLQASRQSSQDRHDALL
jgi:hypothetical protein